MDGNAYKVGSSYFTVFDDDIQEIYYHLSLCERLEFVRGMFDNLGKVFKTSDGIKAALLVQDEVLEKEIRDLIDIPCSLNDGCQLVYTGVNALEFLHKLYSSVNTIKYNKNVAYYNELLYSWKPVSQLCDSTTFKFKKVLPDAVAPAKAHVSDTGYDLVLISKIKEENGAIFYDTGISVTPPTGYYFEVVPRSSISKTGYILANSVGIIDQGYTGSIKVALRKVHSDAPDLELPARLVQLIPRAFIHLNVREVEELDETTRATGGFGSTG